MQSESIGATIVPSEMDGMFDPIIIATQELILLILPLV